MQEITEIAELKEIQLGILRKVDELCKAHHLKYFMSDGTLLGAVRHKGYIPWDDDLDIWMPRKDYEKLEQIMNQEDSCYKVVNHKNTKGKKRIISNMSENVCIWKNSVTEDFRVLKV